MLLNSLTLFFRIFGYVSVVKQVQTQCELRILNLSRARDVCVNSLIGLRLPAKKDTDRVLTDDSDVAK